MINLLLKLIIVTNQIGLSFDNIKIILTHFKYFGLGLVYTYFRWVY